MIVCSCNVISDHEVRNAASASEAPGRLTEVYRRLGRTPECGRCQRTIKELVVETYQKRDWVDANLST
jgi:bacterioferritin-associated ferredoxin